MAEQTKQCKECLVEIPKKARKCSHCGSRQPENAYAWLVIILLVTGGIVYLGYDPAPQVTYTPPAPQNAPSDPFVATHYVDPTEFGNGAIRELNVFRSYEDRTKVGELLGTHEVEVTDRDEENDYCEVLNDEVKGWVACDWLIEIE